MGEPRSRGSLERDGGDGAPDAAKLLLHAHGQRLVLEPERTDGEEHEVGLEVRDPAIDGGGEGGGWPDGASVDFDNFTDAFCEGVAHARGVEAFRGHAGVAAGDVAAEEAQDSHAAFSRNAWAQVDGIARVAEQFVTPARYFPLG